MDEIIEALQALIKNPDDLSSLPGVITQLQERQTEIAQREADDLDRITTLQQANRSLLAQIPVGTGESDNKDNTEDDKVTFEDAQKELINAMNNVGGN